MASMKEVATRAGVSITTVSHVLNNTRKVKADTVDRVLRVTRELGYATSPGARSESAMRLNSDILGLIVSDIDNPFFTETIKGFHEQALAYDMEPVVLQSNYDPLRTLNAAKRLMNLGVAGVAVLVTEPLHVVQEALASAGVCAVYLDSEEVKPRVGSLNLDYAAGIQQAVAHLKELGHERIGYIGSQLNLDAIKIRKQAFIECMPEAQSNTQWMIETEGTVEGGYFACCKLYARYAPTAIVCSNDLLAIGALHYAADQGIQVPGRLSIVGFDNIRFTKFTMPELTTVDLPRLECGRQAFDILKSMMSDTNHEGRSVRINPQLIVRQSTGPAARE